MKKPNLWILVLGIIVLYLLFDKKQTDNLEIATPTTCKKCFWLGKDLSCVCQRDYWQYWSKSWLKNAANCDKTINNCDGGLKCGSC